MQWPFVATSRPRYCPDQPLMWREPGVVQFGTDERRIIVDRITADDVRWLMDLNGLVMWSSVDLADTGHRRLLQAAIAAGAIDDASRTPDAWRVLPIEQRARHFGDIAASRHTYVDIDRSLTAIDRRFTARVHIIGDDVLGAACVHAIEHCGATVTADEPDITILAGGFHPDASFHHPAFRETGIATRPHVPVAAFGNAGFAGPLVVPGRTSCLTCHQLHRCDADRAWAVLVSQRAALATALRQWPVDAAHAFAIAAHAALLIRSWRENPQVEHLWANQARCVWLPDGSVDVLDRPIHPRCGCTWSPMGEEPATASQWGHA
jgi:hypothetical protein